MKAIKLAFIIMGLAMLFASCEKDPEIDYSPIYPMCGEWIVQVKDAATGNLISPKKFIIGTYNTADNSTTEMWIRCTNAAFPLGGTFKGGALRGKINVDLAAKTFSGTNIADLTSATGATFTITNGSVVLNGADTPSGYKADKFSFTYQSTKLPGVTYLVEGFRRTLWPEDE